jgi:hypothetical protein
MYLERIDLQHHIVVPRSENSPCDNVCANYLMTVMASVAWRLCHRNPNYGECEGAFSIKTKHRKDDDTVTRHPD